MSAGKTNGSNDVGAILNQLQNSSIQAQTGVNPSPAFPRAGQVPTGNVTFDGNPIPSTAPTNTTPNTNVAQPTTASPTTPNIGNLANATPTGNQGFMNPGTTSPATSSPTFNIPLPNTPSPASSPSLPSGTTPTTPITPIGVNGLLGNNNNNPVNGPVAPGTGMTIPGLPSSGPGSSIRLADGTTVHIG